jgi:hypothetical protein
MFLWTITRRVAAGWFMLPLQGGRKKYYSRKQF